ncbi:hypothetical protein BMS3Bbin04_01237 [bacterium BMS3Bbin04]|nr:hypothetical protein BMS3Bbin04_01237 [bacterium BMS3Bbin04]
MKGSIRVRQIELQITFKSSAQGYWYLFNAVPYIRVPEKGWIYVELDLLFGANDGSAVGGITGG